MISPLVFLKSSSYAAYPSHLKGLRLLLDSTVGVTSTSGVVTGWNDVSSGNGGTFGQVTASLRPTVAANSLNGKQTLRFNGSVIYSTNNNYDMGRDSLLMYVVACLDALNGSPAGAANLICGCGGFVTNSQSVGRYRIRRDVNNYTYGDTWTNGLYSLNDTIAAFSSAWRLYMIHVQRVNSGSIQFEFYVHDRKLSMASNDNKGVWSPGAPFQIGGNCAADRTQYTSESQATTAVNNVFLRGNIAEVGLYMRDWPYRPDEIRKLQKSLRLKWGLSAI